MRKRQKSDKVFFGRVMHMPIGRPRTRTDGDKYNYDQQYIRSNVTFINVSFNRRKPDDVAILNWLNGLNESKVGYIKRLIREDMEK